jgi:hypothetical protein
MLKKISDYFSITEDGLFTSFINPVWAVPFPDTAELDRYFLLRYGDRIGSKICEFYADSEDGTIKGDKLSELASMVYDINARKWEHLFGVYEAEYNPIENTDYIETINETNANIRTDVGNTTNSGTSTTTNNGTATGSNNGAINEFGFDSADAVGKGTNNGTNTNTVNSSSTITSNDTSSGTNTINDNNTHISEHRKHGNIGTVDAVTLARNEVDFWKWSFIDQICKDICDIIALSIY